MKWSSSLCGPSPFNPASWGASTVWVNRLLLIFTLSRSARGQKVTSQFFVITSNQLSATMIPDKYTPRNHKYTSFLSPAVLSGLLWCLFFDLRLHFASSSSVSKDFLSLLIKTTDCSFNQCKNKMAAISAKTFNSQSWEKSDEGTKTSSVYFCASHSKLNTINTCLTPNRADVWKDQMMTWRHFISQRSTWWWHHKKFCNWSIVLLMVQTGPTADDPSLRFLLCF